MIAYRILGNYLLSYDENAVGCAAASSLDCMVRMSLKWNYDIVFSSSSRRFQHWTKNVQKRKRNERTKETKELKLDQFLLYAYRWLCHSLEEEKKIVSFSNLIDCFYWRKDIYELWCLIFSRKENSESTYTEWSLWLLVCLFLFNKQTNAICVNEQRWDGGWNFSLPLCSCVQGSIVITSTPISIYACKQSIVDTSHTDCRRRRRPYTYADLCPWTYFL
jgi:hypothetical protein